jgi:hypothetical protein
MQLNQVLTEASRHGFTGAQLEARLTLEDLKEKAGQTAAAQTQFLALERTARTKGLSDREQGGEPTVESMTSEGKAPGAPAR